MAIMFFTAKMYMQLFGIGKRAAETWLRRDKQKYSTELITIGHVRNEYMLTDDDINKELYPKSAIESAVSGNMAK